MDELLILVDERDDRSVPPVSTLTRDAKDDDDDSPVVSEDLEEDGPCHPNRVR